MLAVSGHGWGHGLGLSQWGAYGYAQHGWSYTRILAHYYPGHHARPGAGTTPCASCSPGEAGDARPRPLPGRVVDATGTVVQLAPGVAQR